MASRDTSKIRRRTTAEDSVAGSLLGGAALALAGIAIAKVVGATPRMVVEGVDLSTADLTRPFDVTFSNRDGSRAIAFAHALRSRFPGWTVGLMLDHPHSTMVVRVDPSTSTPHERILRKYYGL